MELRVFWRTLRRRWYLTIVVVALTVGATAYVVRDVGPTYEAEGSALVFPPASSIKEEGETAVAGNPYLELAGVNQARDVVIRTLKSRTVQMEWGEDFPGMEYEATPDFTNSAPIILFTVAGGSSDATAAGLDDLLSRVPAILLDLQDGLGLSSEGQVTARKLTQDSRPAVVRKGQIRAGMLAVAATAGLGLLALALIDSLLVSRGRRRAASSDADADADAADRAEAPEEPDPEPAPAPEPEAEPEPDPPDEEVFVYRIPVDVDLAASPARARSLRPVPPDPARNGHPFRDTPSGKPRASRAGRKR